MDLSRVFVLSLLLSAAAFGQAASSPASKPAGGDDYWVEPMKKVHEKFTGQKGVVGQFGDSITITMAFFYPLRDANIKNMPKGLPRRTSGCAATSRADAGRTRGRAASTATTAARPPTGACPTWTSGSRR
jgi:hypothetical protein